MELWELVARESIRDLVARYNANGDAGRLDEVLALFTPDATLEIPGRVYRGLSEIRAMFGEASQRTGRGSASRASFIRHFTATHQIDLLGPAAATGRCYYLVLSDRGIDHWGRYRDEYRQVDGSWRFASRSVSVDSSVPGGWGDRSG